MGLTNDPVPLAELVQQTPTPAEMPVGMFLGAGCPLSIRSPEEGGDASPLIPEVAGLTSEVCAELPRRGVWPPPFRDSAQLPADGKGPGNIEDNYTRL